MTGGGGGGGEKKESPVKLGVIWLASGHLTLNSKASSKGAYNCRGNQDNAVLLCNTASYCP